MLVYLYHIKHPYKGGVRDEHAGEVFVSMVNSTLSTSFLADTGASHQICHDTSYFSKFSPLSGPFQVHHVDGSFDVAHSGQVILEVNSDSWMQLVRTTLVRVPNLQCVPSASSACVVPLVRS